VQTLGAEIISLYDKGYAVERQAATF